MADASLENIAHLPETFVLWDVDHTLIENGGVSKETYALAFELLTGCVPSVRPATDGRTDFQIMRLIHAWFQKWSAITAEIVVGKVSIGRR
jgi:hypothetical protein